MRLLLLTFLTTGGLALSACGEGGLSPSAYTAGVEKACAANARFNQGLPARSAKDQLTTGQVEKLAKGATEKFIASIEALEPPSTYADEATALTKHLRRGVDVPITKKDDAVDYLSELRADYTALGAKTCADGAQKSIDALAGQGPSA